MIWYSHELDRLIEADGKDAFIFRDQYGEFIMLYNLGIVKPFTLYRFDYIGEL